MKMKQTVPFSIAASLLLILPSSSVALADSGSQIKKQIHQIEKKRQDTLNNIQSKKSDLDANKQQQADIANKVQKLDSQITNLDYKIHVKQDSIKTNQQNIEALKKNISALKKRIKKRNQIIADRARTVYMNSGSNHYLQLLLDSNNFQNLLNRVIFVYKIAQQDKSILKQQVEDKQKLVKEQDALQKTQDQLKSDLKNLQQMKDDLASKKDQQQSLLKQLKSKAMKMQLAVQNQQKQAAVYQNQVAAHKKELAAWVAKQKKAAQHVHYSNPSGVPAEVAPFIQPAQQLEKSTGIPAAITLAQITLESDMGGQLSELATAGKNLFGIKGEGPAGTMTLSTQEVIGGEVITINAGFKKYNSYYQGMVDHAKVLQQPRYQYFLKNAHNLSAFAYGIQNGGYSTDPNYATKLLTLINLYKYDRYDTGGF